jgi:hypothetical protein
MSVVMRPGLARVDLSQHVVQRIGRTGQGLAQPLQIVAPGGRHLRIGAPHHRIGAGGHARRADVGCDALDRVRAIAQRFPSAAFAFGA